MRNVVGGMGLVVVSLLGVDLASAQDKTITVSGIVKDDEGRRLEGATIEVLGTKLSATTTDNGEFRMERVPGGRYWILVRRIGYSPIRMSATLVAGQNRDIPIELERVPQKLSELTVVARGGMSKYRYQDFFMRSHSAFGKFLTRDDIAQARSYDLVSLVQRYMPGKTRFALERRSGEFDFAGGQLIRRGGRVYARDELGFYQPLGSSALGVYNSPNCTPSISINGSTPWPGVALTDFDIDQVEAIEVYRRGSWVPTEFSYRDTSGCGLVVIWTK